MSGQKALDNIGPFNDIFYKMCYYNALFSVVNHLGKSVLPFLASDVYAYNYDTNKNIPNIDFKILSFKTDEQLLKESGIVEEAKEPGYDVIEDIIESISADKPVILFVDCYYESIRRDVYLKHHWPHSLLIYGYDESKQVCNVIEHKYRDSLTYDKCTLSYLDTINALNGYMTNFMLEGDDTSAEYLEVVGTEKNSMADLMRYLETFPVKARTKPYFEYSLAQGEEISISVEECMKTFKETLYNNREVVDKGLEGLKLFVENYKALANSEQFPAQTFEDLNSSTNNILTIKQVEKYKMSQLLKDRADIIGVLDEIISNWGAVRASVAKMMYSGAINANSFVFTVDKLEEICHLEQKYNEMMFSSL
ncbi:MAG: BtrH N-terminal domain-containing protein [Clostridia bacterium]|nr:BtrH N-terminal domain-containing protein [Clostridia bacterium]